MATCLPSLVTRSKNGALIRLVDMLRRLEDCFTSIGRGKIRARVFLKKRPELLFTHCEHHYIFYILREDACPLIIAALHENMNLVTRLKNRFRA